MNDAFRLLALAAAYAVALSTFARSAARGRCRFVLALHLSGLAAYVGFQVLFDPDPIALERLAKPEGASVLFVPLGVLLAAPFREALAALPLALAVARLGCIPYDCCYDTASSMAPEVVALMGLHVAARAWPLHATSIVLCGFGAIRLLSLPLRREPAVEPFVDPAWVAGAWIVAGVLLRERIGSAEEAREWLTQRMEPLLRALVLMLGVWLLFPLGAVVFGDPAMATPVAASAALALLLAVRRPVLPQVSLRSLGVLVAASFVGAAIASLAEAGLGGVGPGGRPGTPAGAAGLVALVVIAPAFEELLYRERLLGVLRSLWGGAPALVASSALFALAHADLRVMPVAFAGGLVCGAVMLRTGSLAAVIGLHGGWNLGVAAVV